MRSLSFAAALALSSIIGCSSESTSPPPTDGHGDELPPPGGDDDTGDEPSAQYTLTVSFTGSGAGRVTSDVGGISCSAGDSTASCTATLDAGSVLQLSVTADSGSRFVGWSGGCSSAGVCAVTVDRDITVIAELVPLTDAFVVTLAGSGSGSVSSAPAGIDCSNALRASSCSTSFERSTSVTLTATAAADSVFLGWSGACTGASPSCTVAVSEAVNVTATFDVVLETLTVTVAGGGAGTVVSAPAGIACTKTGGTCSASFPRGTMVTLTATAGLYAGVGAWSIGGCSGTACITGVPQTVTATFDALGTYAPLVTAADLGSRAQGQVQAVGMPYFIATAGEFPSSSNSGIARVPLLGEVMAFPPGFATDGFLPCDGSVLRISQHTALYAAIGTSFGGDGVTTFALPNLTDRVPVGAGTIQGSASFNPGDPSAVARIENLTLGGQAQGTVRALGMHYLIATVGVYPTRDGGGDDGTPFVGQILLTSSPIVPGGYLRCDGQLVQIQANQVLFSVLGAAYGGDGITTFAVPDLRGRAPLGSGALTSYTPPTAQALQSPLISDVTLGATADGQLGIVGVTPLIRISGDYPPRFDSAQRALPRNLVGSLTWFAGGYPMQGHSSMVGQLLAISNNQVLFSLLGTYFGGNGQSNFALPNVRGRAVAGAPSR